jgi:hypothetical protein
MVTSAPAGARSVKVRRGAVPPSPRSAGGADEASRLADRTVHLREFPASISRFSESPAYNKSIREPQACRSGQPAAPARSTTGPLAGREASCPASGSVPCPT